MAPPFPSHGQAPPGTRECSLSTTVPRLPLQLVVMYSLPNVAIGTLMLIFEVYILKFATDSLLIPPAAIGTIFSISRLWDAISDPLVGYLSDITRTPFGRRRSWMLAAALPIWGAFYATFAPPASLSCKLLAAWMLPSILCLYTALTAFKVPHLGLGTELTEGIVPHERSTLFSWYSGALGIGNIIGTGALSVMMSQEAAGPGAVRSAAELVALLAGALTALTILILVFSLPDRSAKGEGLLSDASDRTQYENRSTPSAVHPPSANSVTPGASSEGGKSQQSAFRPMRVAGVLMRSKQARRMTLVW